MGGAVVMIVVLVVFPVLVLVSGAAGAAIVGSILKLDRDAAHEGTEHLAISEANPYQR
jgi:hypothetical protein